MWSESLKKGEIDNSSYCDKKNQCWWCPIVPRFDAGGRGGFGIHPDGGKGGTAGCIGIKMQDSSSIRNFLEKNFGGILLVK